MKVYLKRPWWSLKALTWVKGSHCLDCISSRIKLQGSNWHLPSKWTISKIISHITLVNVKAPLVATTSWWWQFFRTGAGVKGKKIYTCWLYDLFISLYLFYLWRHVAHRSSVTLQFMALPSNFGDLIIGLDGKSNTVLEFCHDRCFFLV